MKLSNIIKTFALVLLVGASVLTVPSYANAGLYENESFLSFKHSQNAFSFDSENYGSSMGTDINIWYTYPFNWNQQWSYNPISKEIVHRLSGLCLDIRAGIFENGTKVQLWECNGWYAQRWVIEDGLIKLDAQTLAETLIFPGKDLNFCIDGHFLEEGYGLQIWGCHGGLNQQWDAKILVGDNFSRYDTITNPLADIIPISTIDGDRNNLQTIFSGARSQDPTVKETLETLVLPPSFDGLDLRDKFMYILNSERTARGLLPLEAYSIDLDSAAFTQSRFMVENDLELNDFNDGSELIASNPVLDQCRDIDYPYTSSIDKQISFVSGGDSNIDTGLYLSVLFYSLYTNSSDDWSVRNHLLSNYVNDSGSVESEGYLGLNGFVEKNNGLNTIYLTFMTIDPKSDCSITTFDASSTVRGI